MRPLQDLHVVATAPLISPLEMKSRIAVTDDAAETVLQSRDAIKDIVGHRDPRLLVVIGPCSLHDKVAALEYAERLNKLRIKYEDRLVILMRTYFEKPRTTVGWRGLINDPHLDGSFDMEEGLKIARSILLEVTRMGLGTGVEMLDPVTPQYIADLVSWAAIGARTTESQTHRAMASGLSMPVGFKNSTDGGLQVAIDAMVSAKSNHSFLGIDQDGRSCVVKTSGNPDCMMILRGGRTQTNYSAEHVLAAQQQLLKAGLNPAIMVDCSHANSQYIPVQQGDVWRAVIDELVDTKDAMIGLMAESNLVEGKQAIPKDLSELKYGVSVTDGCIGWEATEALLAYAYERTATKAVAVA